MHSQPSLARLAVGLLFCVPVAVAHAEDKPVFRAGAAAVDITPQELPVLVSGGFLEQQTSEIKDRLHARALVLDDGRGRVVIAVVDNCVIPRDVFDEAKRIASARTGIPAERMLMSATHTHTAPALDPLLGSGGNPGYKAWLPGQIARAVEAAVASLAPARIGWTVVQDAEHTHCRQWIRRPDRIDLDPFGRRTVRSMMHPGFQNPDYLGPAGPVDPDLSLVSVQSASGKPIAVLANYSMHYVGAQPLSADYFGLFGEKLAALLQAESANPPFICMMSNGTSGDLHWMDYSRPKPERPPTHVEFAEMMAKQAIDACAKIDYRDWAPLDIRETTLRLTVRPISDTDLAKARELSATFKDRPPKTLPEVYALQQVRMSEHSPMHDVKLQALRIGDLGIAAIPCEVFGITGLQIKAQSPLTPTFTIELANGYHGYIPPPAQHALGGYTTWRATSACLEVDAAPKITEAVLGLLEEVSGQKRRTLTSEDFPFGEYPAAILASKPFAYWRMNEFEGPQAVDASGSGNHATYEPGVVFYLEGAGAEPDGREKRINRSPQFAGGRMIADVKSLGPAYTVELWFNNYLPTDVREVTGQLLAREQHGPSAAPGDHLAITGQGDSQGRVAFWEAPMVGRTNVGVKSWNHLAFVRDATRALIYLNGDKIPELSVSFTDGPASAGDRLFIGGSSEPENSFEGRIDEVAVYARALSPEEIVRHYRAAAGTGR